VLIASSKQELQHLVSQLHESATQMEMEINAVKTEVMAVNAGSDKMGTMTSHCRKQDRSNILVSSSLRILVTRKRSKQDLLQQDRAC
jgi:hypothetical protein